MPGKMRHKYNFAAANVHFKKRISNLGSVLWHAFRFIFVPVNLHMNNWFAIVLDLEKGSVICLDSMQVCRFLFISTRACLCFVAMLNHRLGVLR